MFTHEEVEEVIEEEMLEKRVPGGCRNTSLPEELLGPDEQDLELFVMSCSAD